MSLPVFLREDAERHIEVTYCELEDVQLGLGRRFVVRIREVLERVETWPELYGIVWRDVRAARLRKFRYVVYYVVLDDRVEVLAVLHGSRDSSVCHSRV